jgi:choline dehydrogenase
MMIAEKSADMILGNTPLEPEHVEFYRHGAVAGREGGASSHG